MDEWEAQAGEKMLELISILKYLGYKEEDIMEMTLDDAVNILELDIQLETP